MELNLYETSEISNMYVHCTFRILTISNQVVYFDAIAPADEIPNHLLLLYLTTGGAAIDQDFNILTKTFV